MRLRTKTTKATLACKQNFKRTSRFISRDRYPRASSTRLLGSDLHPAIFAGYRDLTALRYDFPLVLVAQPTMDSRCNRCSGLIVGAVKADRGRQ